MPKATRLEEKEQFSEPISIISFLKFLSNKTMLHIVLEAYGINKPNMDRTWTHLWEGSCTYREKRLGRGKLQRVGLFLFVCLLVSFKGCRGYAESPDGWNKRSQDRLHIRSHHTDTVTAPCSSNKDLEQMAPGGLTFLVFVYSSGGQKGKPRNTMDYHLQRLHPVTQISSRLGHGAIPPGPP